MNSMSNESVRHGQDRCWLDKFFKLSQHGTNVRTEIFAGITMFIASVYILARLYRICWLHPVCLMKVRLRQLF